MLSMSRTPSLLDPEIVATLALAGATTFSDKGIVSRAVLSTPTLRVTLFGFAVGQELTEHASSSRAIVQILNGASDWIVEGKAMRLAAGEILHMPPGARHAVRAGESFSMLLTLVKEPTAATEAPPDTN
ncbi:cupin domain-containing protein [Opitutales bacterium ASA1]|nr:cupin domain-containing protein [Opitutales bacterium ASA1]